MSEQQINTGKIFDVPIEEGLKKNYLTYAMSVIIGRYIPDVRDGLKPVHRRILYSMYENNLSYSSKTRKSSKVIGDVLGKYHPHGDVAVYEALVRMAQDFSMRYPLILGQGNFGSVDGDPPAAMRYTEVKLEKLADSLLADIDEKTVDFIPNYDNTEMEPTVLPASYPNLLVNGSIGIAVAMSTNIPPHNLAEILQATSALIHNPDITLPELMEFVKAPDFPTGGIILGTDGIKKAYETGKGSFYIRGQAHVEENEKKGKTAIILTEIPYGIKKSSLIIDIANYVKDDQIKGISEIRDESNKDGMRVVLEVKRGMDAQVILNQIYSRTQLQTSYSMNLLAIVDREPRLMGLKEILTHFINHRQEVVVRRAEFRLKKAQDRLHVVAGLVKAIDNLDEVIKLIRASQTAAEAKQTLILRFELSDIQAQAILDLRLNKLTALEKLTLENEKNDLEKNIGALNQFLASNTEQLELIHTELIDLGNKFKTQRKTEITEIMNQTISMEDIISNNEWLIMISSEGIIKRTSLDSYSAQRRGGQGKTGAKVRDTEEMQYMFTAFAHDYLLFFTNLGHVYYVKTYDIPEATLQSRGKSIYALIPFKEGETIASYLLTSKFAEDQYVMFITQKGMIKKTSLSQFINAKKRGIVAITLQEKDTLLKTMLVEQEDEIFITTKKGKGLRIISNSVRPTGRSSQGVIAIRIKAEGDAVIGITLVDDKTTLLALTEKGFGKRVAYSMFTAHGRGTGGQIYYGITKETGDVVCVEEVSSEEDELIILSKSGMAMRMRAKDIRIMGRSARGNRTVRLKEDDTIADCTVLTNKEDDELI